MRISFELYGDQGFVKRSLNVVKFRPVQLKKKEPWRATKVHKPPNWHQRVKSPCA